MQTLLPAILQDLRYALRQLRRAPVFSAAVMGTVALAVGATATMSGILRATLLHALPYRHPEQLISVGDQNLRGFKTNGLMALLRIDDLAQLQHNGHPVFASTGFYYSDDSSLSLDSQNTVRLPATAVSGTFFSTIGTAALLGRTITPADVVPGRPELVVLSYRLWQSTFGGDPHVLARTVRLGAEQATVIGVMPPQFALPAGAALWHPSSVFPVYFRGYRGDGSRFLSVIARLDPAETIASARLATTQLAARLAASFPTTDAAWGFTLTDLRAGLFGEYRQALLLIATAVALVLLAAAVNIAGLQLSRNAARQSEFAVRVALGINRHRLAQMLTVETLTPVVLGGLAGIGLAGALLRLAVAHLPPELLRVDRPRLDLPVLAASMVIVLTVGLLTAAAPIVHGIRPADSGRVSDRSAFIAGHNVLARSRTLGRLLSSTQIALALVLLTLSAAVLLNLYRLLTTPLGFDTTQVQTFTVDLPWGTDGAKLHRLYAQLEDAFANLPEVESAGAITSLPLSNFSARETFDIAGQAPTPHHDAVVAEGRDLTPGYLHAMHIPLLRGRSITKHDAEPEAPPVLLINHALAARYFPNADPVGKHLNGLGGVDNKNVADAGEIIGVVGDVHGTGGALDGPVQPEIYRPDQGGWPHMQFALRMRPPLTSQPTRLLLPDFAATDRIASPDAAFQVRVRGIVSSLDATASPGHFATLSGTLDRSLLQPRLNAALLSSFAALALLLVIIGVYSLIAFDVTRRTRELALRIALGATRGSVLRLLIAESSRMLALGLSLGLGASWTVARILRTASSTFAGHTPPLLLILVVALLAAAVVLATLVPARRAAQVDPMQALRSE